MLLTNCFCKDNFKGTKLFFNLFCKVLCIFTYKVTCKRACEIAGNLSCKFTCRLIWS